MTKIEITRNPYIELLRIIAMLLIVACHYSFGIVNSIEDKVWFEIPYINRLFIVSFLSGGQIGVGIFFAITGYFMVYKEQNLKRIVSIVFQVYCANLFFLFLYVFIKLSGFWTFPEFTGESMKSLIINTLFPISSSEYWFIIAYIVLFLFSPCINKFLRSDNIKNKYLLLFLFWLIEYCPGIFSNFVYEGFGRAFLFYCVGGLLRLNQDEGKFPNRWNFKLILLLSYFACIFLYYILYNLKGDTVYCKIIKLFSSAFSHAICIPLIIFSFLVIFLDNKKSNTGVWWGGAVCAIGSTTFGIYLLHEHVITKSLLWGRFIKTLEIIKSQYFVYISTLLCFVIFFVCMFIDIIFQKIIKKNLYQNIYAFIDKIV